MREEREREREREITKIGIQDGKLDPEPDTVIVLPHCQPVRHVMWCTMRFDRVGAIKIELGRD